MYNYIFKKVFIDVVYIYVVVRQHISVVIYYLILFHNVEVVVVQSLDLLIMKLKQMI